MMCFQVGADPSQGSIASALEMPNRRVNKLLVSRNLVVILLQLKRKPLTGFIRTLDNIRLCMIFQLTSCAIIPMVLESFLKSEVSSRAEISDVACARRVNCVMLNKGKHVL